MVRLKTMKKEFPLITIGITCFNAQDLIIRAIKHAQLQDWPNYEIVIVDDGSSDNSVSLIKEYIATTKNVFLFEHTENKGFPGALNTIIKNGKGDYFVFFDDDDVSVSDRLAKQYQRLSTFIEEKKTSLVMCYTNRNVKYENSNDIAYSFTAIGSSIGREPHGSMVADYILWHPGKVGYQWGMFGSCTLMVHKNLFKKIGNFDETFRRNTEWDMAIRCALEGGHFIAVDEALVTQTKTPTADKAGKKPLYFSLLLREKYKDLLKKDGVYLGARLISKSRFCGGRGRKYQSHGYSILAAIVSPHRILKSKVINSLSKCSKRASV